MSNSVIWSNVITFIGGGLVVYFIDLALKSGKVKIDSYALKLTHLHTHDLKQNVIIKFVLDIQFINNSGHSKIVNNFEAYFYDGLSTHDLIFDGFSVPPAEVLPPKDVVCLQFSIGHANGNFYSPVNNEKYLFVLSYNLNNKSHKIEINSKTMIFADMTGTAMVF